MAITIMVVLTLTTLLGTASAETSYVNGQQIKITAVVLPAIYVVVDRQNQVQEIISNTYERNTSPTIYQDSVKLENVQALTPDIKQHVTMLLSSSLVKPGLLFKRSIAPPEKKVLPLLTNRK